MIIYNTGSSPITNFAEDKEAAMSGTGSNPVTSFEKPKSGWTEDQARILLGKHILVGIAHCGPEGKIVSREQIHGIIERANPQESLVIKLHGSDTIRAIPLDVSTLKMARSDDYRLTSTGEIVKDPDYTMRIALNQKGEMIKSVD